MGMIKGGVCARIVKCLRLDVEFLGLLLFAKGQVLFPIVGAASLTVMALHIACEVGC